jgi:hypothetical protein
MQSIDRDLWTAVSPLRFVGLEVGARMTVVRLPDGRLWLHSPIAASPERVREVQALGPVAFLVAPNRFHHLYVGEWQQAFPEASVYVAPGLETKRADLAITGVLGDEPEPGWKDTIDQTRIEGFPFANEVVFFHRPTATLIASDLAFHFGPSSAPLTRWVARLGGGYDRLAPTLVERLLIKDRAAFGRSLARILAWPFERVIVAHGAISETGGREEIVQGYAFVLDHRHGA